MRFSMTVADAQSSQPEKESIGYGLYQVSSLVMNMSLGCTAHIAKLSTIKG